MRWTAAVKRGTQAVKRGYRPHMTTEHVRVFAGERCRRCVVESTQRLLDGRLTSDDANSTSHTLAWLCTSEAPCWDRGGGGGGSTREGVYESVLHDAKTHELGCGVGGVGEERREKKVAIPEIRQAWLEQPRRPLAIDRSWPCPGHGNADLFRLFRPSLMVF